MIREDLAQYRLKAMGASSADVSKTRYDCIMDEPQIDIVSIWNISEFVEGNLLVCMNLRRRERQVSSSTRNSCSSQVLDCATVSFTWNDYCIALVMAKGTELLLSLH
ncbi:hypothetical protein MKX01_038527 [Papaver californicum]|nr:hypothetical protein MKX01_038527 [Papaver californicum]